MDFGSVQLFQLTVVGLISGVIFLVAYSMPLKITAAALVVLIPFQPVVTQYATSNVVVTWAVFMAMLMRHKDVRLPLLPQFLVVLFAVLIATGVQDPSTYSQHMFFVFNLVSAYLVLCVVYEWTLSSGSLENPLRVFTILNVLVVTYCGVQALYGPGNMPALFGIEEFRLEDYHPTDTAGYRLTGPFGAVGPLTEFSIFSFYLLIYQTLTTKKAGYKRFLYALAVANIAIILMTKGRGGLIVLGVSILLFAWLFRSEIGLKRTMQVASGVIVAFVVAVGSIAFSEGKVEVFQRLANTEIERGVPDSREQAWTGAWTEIKQRPIFGHGPRLKFAGELDDRTYEHHKFIQPPHNLYLTLLFTVGILGLIAFLLFLATPLFRAWKHSRSELSSTSDRLFAKIGIIIMIVFFAHQIKIEFLRYGWTDYWHYLFAIIGFMTAAFDRMASPILMNRSVAAVADNALAEGAQRRKASIT